MFPITIFVSASSSRAGVSNPMTNQSAIKKSREHSKDVILDLPRFTGRAKDPVRDPSVSGFRMTLAFLSVFVFFLAILPSAVANVLGNPSFEEPIGSGSNGNWDSTNGATLFTNATKPAGFSNVPYGLQATSMSSPAGNFTFQVVNNVKPGQLVTFSAVAESSIAIGGGVQRAVGGSASASTRPVRLAASVIHAQAPSQNCGTSIFQRQS